jgi:hypothetical protein
MLCSEAQAKIVEKSSLFTVYSHTLQRDCFALDYAASTQSHADPCDRLGGIGKSTFSHRIAWRSPFMSEWTANRDRTDRNALMSGFRLKFSGNVLLSATYGRVEA